MKIEKLHLQHFGKFKDLDLDFGPAFHVFYGENEDGKSTILDAIQLAFYGSDSRSADPQQNLRHRYFDQAQEKPRVLLQFQDKDQFFRLDRTFGSTNARDQVILLNDRTGEEIVLKRNQTPGELFFEMNADSFRRSFFVGSKGAVMSSSGKKDQLIDRLVNLETTGDEKVSYVSIASRLESSSKELINARGNGGRIPEIEKKIQDLRLRYEEALAGEEIKKKADWENQQRKGRIQILNENLREIQEKKEELRAQLNLTSLYEAKKIRFQLKSVEENCQLLSDRLNDQEMPLDEIELSALKEDLAEWRRIREKRIQRAREEKADSFLDQEEKDLFVRGEMLQAQKAMDEEKLQVLEKDLALLADQEKALQDQIDQQKERKKKLEDQIFAPGVSISQEDVKRIKDIQPKQQSLWIRIRDMAFLWLFRWSFILLFLLGYRIYHATVPARYYYLAAFVLLGLVIGYVSYRLKKYQQLQKQKKKMLELENQAFQERVTAMEEEQKLHKNLKSRLNEINADLDGLKKVKTQLSIRKDDLDQRKNELQRKEGLLKDQFYQLQSDQLDLKRKKEMEERAEKKRKEEELADQKRQEELSYRFEKVSANWEKKERSKADGGLSANKRKREEDPSLEWENLLREIQQTLQKLHDQELVWDHLYRSLPEKFQEMTEEDFQRELMESGLSQEEPKSADDLAQAMAKADQNNHDLLEEIAACRLEIVESESSIRERFAGKATAETIALQISEEEKKRKVLLEKKEALDLAQEILQEAYQDTENSFSPLLNERAGEVLSRLTGESYKKLKVNREFDLAVEEASTRKVISWKLLSTGTAEQAYFSLRIALIDLMNPEKDLPVFLDDPFVYYDDLRAERAFHFLTDYAQETGRQLLFFTAHQRYEKWAKEQEKRNLVRLDSFS